MDVAFATFSKRGNIFSLRKIGTFYKQATCLDSRGRWLSVIVVGFDSREIETRMGLHDNETRFISRRERERKWRPLGELSLTWENNVTRQEGNLYQRVEWKKKKIVDQGIPR